MSHKTPEQLTDDAAKVLIELDARTSPFGARDRKVIPLQEMPAQDPDVRRRNVEEVAVGYSLEQARVEAYRCLQCKNAPCVNGCPVRIKIPEFIQALVDDKPDEAVAIIKQDNTLPGVCGRVCPQESQCQAECTLGKMLKDPEKGVSIGRLERYASDWERDNGTVDIPDIPKETGKKIAIVGSGPAGLTAAADLRRAGHSVTIFEALHKAGGVLVYGIPEFRLPKVLVQREIETLEAMGVEVKTNFIVGRTRKLADMLAEDGFDMAFIGSGAGLPKFMNVPGENLVGVYSANEYLTRSNLMKAYETDKAETPIARAKKVAVLGGGNVAMDAARMALRLGADESNIIYRRTEKEMPARDEEIEHAKEEGVQFHLLRSPSSMVDDGEGHVKGLECLKYELGEPDDSGRRRPVAIEGSEFFMEADAVVVAIGNDPNPLIPTTTPDLETTKWGGVIVNETGQTSITTVYAGGDIVRGAATVILAMGDARLAAAGMNEALAKS